jgi:hypothetical protein
VLLQRYNEVAALKDRYQDEQRSLRFDLQSSDKTITRLTAQLEAKQHEIGDLAIKVGMALLWYITGCLGQTSSKELYPGASQQWMHAHLHTVAQCCRAMLSLTVTQCCAAAAARGASQGRHAGAGPCRC